jgi:hypothetical protein
VEGTADCGFVICGQRNRLKNFKSFKSTEEKLPNPWYDKPDCKYMSPFVGLEKLKLQK